MSEKATAGNAENTGNAGNGKPRRSWWLWAGALVCLALVFWFFGQPPEGPFTGERAPDFTVTTLTGEQIDLASLRGEPIFINFWATWCAPCREEMPEIQALVEAHPGEFHVVAVSDEARSTVEAYLKEFDYTFPIYLDHRGAMGRTYLVTAMPTSLFIDERGIIRARHVGQMTREQMETYLRQIVADWDQGPDSEQG